MSKLDDVVIVSGVRTAIGKFGGSFKDVSAIDLGAIVIREAINRAKLAENLVDEVIVGNVGQIAENGFIARMVSLNAGLSKETTAYSVNRQCGSGLQAIVNGMLEIQSGNSNIVVACGTENMSSLPYYDRGCRYGYKMGHAQLEDGLLSILTWPGGPYHNGMTAEYVAEKYSVNRAQQDQFAFNSQQKAIYAIKNSLFEEQIVPVELKDKKGSVSFFKQDEHVREDVSIEKLSKLKPAFKSDGTVTAANSSGINDGAAAVVLMSAKKADELGVKPFIKIVGYAIAGNEPELMGYAPKFAIEKLLKKYNLNIEDIDLFELNEAFASQSFAVIRDLKIDENKVNVNGGAIALGHPVGASGTIITVKLMYELKRRQAKRGVAAMCVGGGQGIAVLFELCN
ncbi:thiolase family protein [Lonepinella koalarum]|nr:thiolase family protein [Lonepinella koalarum]MDH2927730.1 acetyl-CoA acetyltransferase [Lonepinella koalarum]TFJ90471.1 thiolase family protein [Lonepinella koalarum]TYG35167.1 thiolase family protein [Lonepinella koalarum]